MLTFIDLVARIALRVLDKIRGSFRLNKSALISATTVPSFILYVSFMDEHSAIAMELLANLHNFCERNHLSDFKLIVRYSSQRGPRWDDKFI